MQTRICLFSKNDRVVTNLGFVENTGRRLRQLAYAGLEDDIFVVEVLLQMSDHEQNAENSLHNISVSAMFGNVTVTGEVK